MSEVSGAQLFDETKRRVAQLQAEAALGRMVVDRLESIRFAALTTPEEEGALREIIDAAERLAEEGHDD